MDTTWGWLPPVDATRPTGGRSDGDHPRDQPDDQIDSLEGLIADERPTEEADPEVEHAADADERGVEREERESEAETEEIMAEDVADAPVHPETVACPACGGACPDGARFCLHCGTPLVEEERPAPTVTSFVAAVACEVEPGSPRGALDRARAALERHGASVTPLTGSATAIAGTFPPEDLQDGDALRAVLAAAEVRRAAQVHATRVGVGTCDVEGGDRENLERSSERAVDLAVRLQRMAGPREIIVGEAVYRLVGDEAAFEPVDADARLDGEGPIGPLRLLAMRSATAAPGLAGPPLVGRDAELERLREGLEHATRERTGALVTVTGEVGSGRTRLVEEFLGDLGEAAVVRVSRPDATEGGTTWPVTEVVERAAGLTGRESFDEATRTMEEALGEGAERTARILVRLAGFPSDEEGSPDETPGALRRLFEALGRARPFVAVVDDGDRADPGFLRLLRQVVSHVRDAVVLVVVTGRPASEDDPTEVRVEPLDRSAARVLVEASLGAHDLDAETLDAIVDACGGVPLVLEQALAMLVADGRLRTERGRWVAAGPITPVSTDTGALLEARLHALPLEERAVLGMAAVIGRSFSLAPLAALLPDEAQAGLRDLLEAMEERRLLRSDETGEVFRFRHPLLREAALSGVPADARARVHENVGGWLERNAGDRTARFAEAVGAHLEAACRHRPGRDQDDEGRVLARRAASCLRAAAEWAAGIGDLRGTAELFRRASSLLRHDDPERPFILIEQAHALAAAGELRRTDTVAAEAERLARMVGADGVEWHAKVLRAGLSLARVAHPEAWEHARSTADRAVEAFGALGDDRGSASAWALRGLVHRSRGHWSAYAGIADRTAEHARRAGRRREETAALRELARAIASGPAPIPEASERCEGVLDRVRGDRSAEHDVLGLLALLRARRGTFGEARELSDAALAAAEELGLDAGVAMTLQRAATIAQLDGDLDTAHDTMRRALQAAERSGDAALQARIAAALARLLCERGRAEEALTLTESAEHAADRRDPETQVAWRAARARALADTGRLAEADPLARLAVRLAEQTDDPELRAGALADLAQVLHSAGRANEAAPFFRRAARLYERRGSTVLASRTRGLLEELGRASG